MGDTSNGQPTAKQCEMLDVHHSDCECTICKEWLDNHCCKPAVGFTQQGNQITRVCEECYQMAKEDPEAYGTVHRFMDGVTIGVPG